jgi:hypothetical protein
LGHFETNSVCVSVLLLKGFNIRNITEYSDHKKYSVDTRLTFPDLDDTGPQ